MQVTLCSHIPSLGMAAIIITDTKINKTKGLFSFLLRTSLCLESYQGTPAKTLDKHSYGRAYVQCLSFISWPTSAMKGEKKIVFTNYTKIAKGMREQT